jgi:hypothetical protein
MIGRVGNDGPVFTRNNVKNDAFAASDRLDCSPSWNEVVRIDRSGLKAAVFSSSGCKGTDFTTLDAAEFCRTAP